MANLVGNATVLKDMKEYITAVDVIAVSTIWTTIASLQTTVLAEITFAISCTSALGLP